MKITLLSSRSARTRVAGLAAALLAATTLAACGGGDSDGADGGTKVTFGYIGDFNGTSLLAVADHEGLWKKAGLDVDTKVFNDGPTQIQALDTGDLDYGYIGPGAMWLPASGKAKVVAINTLGKADRVIAQPDSGITSLADLKGKKIGVPPGTSGDMILTLALEKAGLSKDDVDIVEMDPDVLVQAFSSGQVDAAGFWYPFIDAIKTQVPDVVELAKDSDFSDTVSFPTAFVSGEKPDEGTTEKVIGVLKQANDYRLQHTDETIKLTADMLKQPQDQVASDAGNSELLSTADLGKDTTDGTVDGWLSGMVDYFVGAGKLQSPAKPVDFYLGDLYTRAGSTS